MKTQNLPPVTNLQKGENCIVQNNLPVFEPPKTTMQFREVISKPDLLQYTAIQKAYKSQELLLSAFRQIFYSVLVSLLEKHEKSLGGCLAYAKFKRNRNKFSFEPQHTQYSSKEFKPTLYKNNRRSRK